MAVQTKIDINRASKEDLMSIEGIGETMADAIIRYRDSKGSFKSVDDIDDVPGIGETRLEHIKQSLSVSGESSRSRQQSGSQHRGSEQRSSQSRRSESEKSKSR